MNSFTSMFGPAARGVQRGVATTTSINANLAVNFAAVNMAKAVLLYSYRYHTPSTNEAAVTVQLESATALRIRRGAANESGGNMTNVLHLEWQLLELF